MKARAAWPGKLKNALPARRVAEYAKVARGPLRLHNAHMDPEDVVATVWPGRPFDMEPLGGGITNHNFKVSFDDGETVVLGRAGKDTELLGIDRQVESAAARMAASIGVGPEVLAFVARVPDHAVHRGLAGPAGGDAAAAEPRPHRRRPSHDPRRPLIPGRFDSFRVVEAYADDRRGARRRPRRTITSGLKRSPAASRPRGRQPTVPGHNDLLNANFIDDGERIRIVDWEYAGMSDRFFDLANFSVNHELDPSQDRGCSTHT